MALCCRRLLSQNCSVLKRLAQIQRINYRNFSSSYEGDGKSTVKVLNNDKEMGLMINSYSETGFRLNNNFRVLGPMAIFPRTVLSWNVDTTDDITENSLRLFCILEPKVDVLVIGTGDEDIRPDIVERITMVLKKYKINVEVLKTEAACSTFNFLNAESRMVAGALLPPKKIKFNDMDLLASQARTKELYGGDADDKPKIST